MIIHERFAERFFLAISCSSLKPQGIHKHQTWILQERRKVNMIPNYLCKGVTYHLHSISLSMWLLVFSTRATTTTFEMELHILRFTQPWIFWELQTPTHLFSKKSTPHHSQLVVNENPCCQDYFTENQSKSVWLPLTKTTNLFALLF